MPANSVISRSGIALALPIGMSREVAAAVGVFVLLGASQMSRCDPTRAFSFGSNKSEGEPGKGPTKESAKPPGSAESISQP